MQTRQNLIAALLFGVFFFAAPLHAYELIMPDAGTIDAGETISVPVDLVIEPGEGAVSGFAIIFEIDPAVATMTNIVQAPVLAAMNGDTGPVFYDADVDICSDQTTALLGVVFDFTVTIELGVGTHHILDLEIQGIASGTSSLGFLLTTPCSVTETVVVSKGISFEPTLTPGSISVSDELIADGFEQGPRRVFLSSQLFDGNDLGSALAGDDACQSLADAQTLGGTWMAWLSDTTTSPSQRFTQSNTGYKRMDGVIVADNYADLIDGELAALINVNELGVAADSVFRTWTATATDGTYLGNSCSEWTSTKNTGRIGTAADEAVGTPSWWTNRGEFGCTIQYSLYCFEQ